MDVKDLGDLLDMGKLENTNDCDIWLEEKDLLAANCLPSLTRGDLVISIPIDSRYGW